MRINIRKKDIGWSFLGSIFQYCTSLFILPLILNRLSQAELGLWYSFASVTMLVMYLDFGFSTTMVRNITYAWSGATKILKQGVDENSVQERANITFIRKILFSCKLVCFVIAIVALLILLTGGTIYVRYITNGVLDQHAALCAWWVYACAAFLNIYFNFYGHALKGIGRISEYHKIVVLSRTLQIAISFVGIQMELGLLALSVAYFASNLFIGVGSKWFLDRSVLQEAVNMDGDQEMSQSMQEKLYDAWSVFSSIWYNAKKSGIISICSYGINQSLTLICSLYLGVSETGPYGLCKQLIQAIMNVSGILFATYQPKMINCMVLNQTDKYRRLFSMCMTVFTVIGVGGILSVAVLSQPLLSLIGSDTDLPVGMFLFMGLYMFLEHNHGEYTAYFTMRNNLEYMPSYILSSILIVLFSWGLAAAGCNIYILMAVHFIVQFCYNNWYWPYKAMKLMHTNVLRTFEEGFEELWNLIRSFFLKR